MRAPILITGTAGFIGFFLAERLVAEGYAVVGLDSLNDYYDTSLKHGRLAASGFATEQLAYNKVLTSTKAANFQFVHLNLEDGPHLEELFQTYRFKTVIHLAAQAGVRYSLENPGAYVQSNLVGFVHILENCRRYEVDHLVYASSSSVYGLNKAIPFSTNSNVDHPISLYAATKKSNELMAHTYSHLFGIPTTGLRFFTVYGPWGRPDMAYSIFTKAILEGKPIKVFNHGNMERDFTYVDDIVEGIVRVAQRSPEGQSDWNPEAPTPSSSPAPYRVYNIGAGRPVNLLKFIETIEAALGIEADKHFMDIQPGDVEITYADTTDLERDFGYRPSTTLEEGIGRFVEWYRSYYGMDEAVGAKGRGER